MLRSSVFSILFYAAILWSMRTDASSLISGLDMSASAQENISQSIAENRKQISLHFERKHVGIEILTAGSTTGNISSLFGHSLLRFIDEDNDPMNDTVIGFEMLALGKPDDLIKGLRGGYEVIPRVMPFSVFLVRYVLNEGRSLHRVILPSTSENIETLKATIQRIVNVSDIAGDYNFFTNNCLTVLKNVLGSSGYPMPSVMLDVPTIFSSILGNTMMTYAPALVIPPAETVLKRLVCDYIVENKKSNYCDIDREIWENTHLNAPKESYLQSFLADDRFWKFLEKSSALQASRLINFWPYSLDNQDGNGGSSYETQTRLSQLKNSLGPKFIPIKDFIKSRDQAVYLRCSLPDAACRQTRRAAALKTWPEEVLKKFSASFAAKIEYEKRRAAQLTGNGKKAIMTWIDSEIVQDMVQFNN